MCLIKVIRHFCGRRVEKLMDVDMICLLEFPRDCTRLDWVCRDDFICRCILPWNGEDRLV